MRHSCLVFENSESENQKGTGGQRARRIKLKEIIVGGGRNWTEESKRTAFFSNVRG